MALIQIGPRPVIRIDDDANHGHWIHPSGNPQWAIAKPGPICLTLQYLKTLSLVLLRQLVVVEEEQDANQEIAKCGHRGVRP